MQKAADFDSGEAAGADSVNFKVRIKDGGDYDLFVTFYLSVAYRNEFGSSFYLHVFHLFLSSLKSLFLTVFMSSK